MKFLHQNIFSKTSAAFFAVGILVWSIPNFIIAQAIPTQASLNLESLIEIPQVTVNGVDVYQDFSRIDWSQKVTIDKKSVNLNSEEVLKAIILPDDIKNIVRTYRDEKAAVNRKILILPWNKAEKKVVADEGMQHAIAQVLVDQGQLPLDYQNLKAQGLVENGNNILDLSDFTPIDSNLLVPIEETTEIIDVKPVESLERVSFIDKIGDFVTGNFNRFVTWLAPNTVYADVATVSEAAIDYLINQQNEDGSWGLATSTRFITTIAALDALQANGVLGTTTTKAVDWVTRYVPDNADYLAQQMEVTIRGGEATTTAEILVEMKNFDDNGFPAKRSYKSDPITTSRAIQALEVAEYEDEGSEPYKTVSLALHYLINTQRFDSGWGISPIGGSTIPVTTEAIEALLLWKHQTLGSTAVDDTLDPAVSSLISTQDSDGTWGNDLLNTALAYHAIKAAGETPTYQLETVEYFENEQEMNGSFDNDIYKTAKVAKALSIATNSGQLIVTDIIPIGTLQTDATTEFYIRIQNPGNVAVDSGKLHLITDNYHYASFDFEDNNLVINANSTADVQVGLGSDRKFLGNVPFKVFVEGKNNVIHAGSRYEETLSFNNASDSRPALPMWWVGYKNVSSGGTPAISYRWANKTDPLLKDYIILLRLQGSSTWSSAAIASTTSAVTVGSLAPDTIYEISFGTRSNSNQVLFFSDPVEVKTSSSHATYTAGTVAGKVIAIDGFVPDVGVVGPTASTTAFSNENGEYLQENVPWGQGYVQVSNFLYESYKDDFEIADNNVTDRNVYTNQKIDTAAPTVTSLSIIGEGDYEMENAEKEIIQYTFTDDIESGGQGVVESARIYYYNPNTASWNLITTQYGTLAGTITYTWNIPTNLIGTDYKIRVIVRDFAGKDSAPYEWGPFELTAGNASPTFTFTAPVSGVPALALANYLIKWTDNDPDNNATTTLSYDPDTNPNNANHTFIASIMEDDPTNQYLWDVTAIATGTQYIRADIVDGYNDTITVYATEAVTIDHNNCILPLSGDWVISSSCTLIGSHTAPQSVTVNAGQVLTLDPNAELFIDFKNYKLLIKDTGGVLIKKSAVLQQSP